MSRILLALVLTALLALVGAFVPLGGRTVAERWNAAPSATAFAERGAREIADAWDRLWSDRPDGRKAAASASRTPPARAAKGSPPGRKPAADGKAPPPAEHHTDEDRSALDRIVAEHATDRPARH